MHRLLQGDVGSGKTVVALLSALHAIENGKQVVLMVPTEILAEQHFISLQQYLKKLELRIGLFKGKMHKKYRELLLQHIGSGHYQMIVGTHALFSEDVSFNDLGLVIIDEQSSGIRSAYFFPGRVFSDDHGFLQGQAFIKFCGDAILKRLVQLIRQ